MFQKKKKQKIQLKNHAISPKYFIHNLKYLDFIFLIAIMFLYRILIMLDKEQKYILDFFKQRRIKKKKFVRF